MGDNWQQQLAKCIKSADTLEAVVNDIPLLHPFSEKAHQQFRMKLPTGFIYDDQHKPIEALLSQVIPDHRETEINDGFATDPVGDLDAMNTPGLIHKYSNRALFIVTGACAIHCRYCFRRHFPYADSQINRENWEPAFNYLRQHNEITEIILSGGDPLMISDERFSQLIDELEEIPQLKRLRIHSRIPSVLPERVNDGLIQKLNNSRFNVSLVTHINHPTELNKKNNEVFNKINQTPIQLLNQSVLLHGVNNSASTLIDLSEKLYENGILPYYLHMLDRVQGAAHFSVKEADALTLMDEMTKALPGYLVPKLVKEIAGEKAKTRIM